MTDFFSSELCQNKLSCNMCRDLGPDGVRWRTIVNKHFRVTTDPEKPWACELDTFFREHNLFQPLTEHNISPHNIDTSTMRNITDNTGQAQHLRGETCVPHTDWCVRFGLPTGETGCSLCSALRESTDLDDRETYVWLIQQLYVLGNSYRKTTCRHLYQREDETVTRGCCNGQNKQVPVFRCKKHNDDIITCNTCHEKET